MANELITTVLKAEGESRKKQNRATASVNKLLDDTKVQARLLSEATIAQAQSAANLILSEAQVSSDGIKKQAEKLSVMREKKVIASTESQYETAIEAVINYLR